MKFKDIKMPEKKETTGNSSYLKLADGEQITAIIAGEPYEFYGCWENGKFTFKNEGDPGAKFRFKINVIVSENGKLSAKIWDQGVKTYNALKELHEEYDLTKTMLKIKRHGMGTDTEYIILPMKKEIDAKMKKQIEAVELFELDFKKKSNGDARKAYEGTPLGGDDWDANEDELPF